MNEIINGFSKLNREDQIAIASRFASDANEFTRLLNSHWHGFTQPENHGDEFAENTVSYFNLPYSLAANFKVNGKDYIVPLVTEESSVIAAASAAAKFWWPLGGFQSRVKRKLKAGHIYFSWKGSHSVIENFIRESIPGMIDACQHIEARMKERGGGIKNIVLADPVGMLNEYYKIEVLLDTREAMGANYINSCLEAMAAYMKQQAEFEGILGNLEIIMAILSNYTPECTVECRVVCNISDFTLLHPAMQGEVIARRFKAAVDIARNDTSRAVTNNKGIFNGIDAFIIATGNDFRAVEAAGHAWASKDGQYKGLSKASLYEDRFTLVLEIPMAVGATGGIINLHPMSRATLNLLGNPDAETLMKIAAAVGMASHFSAIKALVTGGIQQGHMKLHLVNLLKQLNASEREKEEALNYFRHRQVTHAGVRDFILSLRSYSI